MAHVLVVGRHRSHVPRGRRDAQLQLQLPEWRRAVRRGRGRRVRHGLLRQGPEVPALPREDRDPDQRRVRPRRHLSRHGALRVGVREVRRDAPRGRLPRGRGIVPERGSDRAADVARVRRDLRRARRRRLRARSSSCSDRRARDSSCASRAAHRRVPAADVRLSQRGERARRLCRGARAGAERRSDPRGLRVVHRREAAPGDPRGGRTTSS